MSVSPSPSMGNLRVEAEVQRRVEDYARQHGQTPGDVVRQAFEEFRARHHDGPAPAEEADAKESVYDLWSHLGFIGCVDSPDLPADLSSNKKYLEGLGRD